MKTFIFEGNNSNEVMAELVKREGCAVQIENLDWATREAVYSIEQGQAQQAAPTVKRKASKKRQA